MRTESPFHPEAFRRLCYWITEREAIRLAKEADKPKPWTQNAHLQTVSFCNIFRMHDKVSKYLLESWYGDDLLVSAAQIAVNAAMARLINLPDTLEELRSAGLNQHYDPSTAHAVLSTRRNRGETIFTSAYIVSGIRGEDKVSTVISQCNAVFHGHARLVDPTSMATTHGRLQAIPAIGSFSAGQIVADLRHVHPGTWADRDTWAPLGPGSLRGLAWLRGWDGKGDPPSLSQGAFLTAIRQLREALHAEPTVRRVLERVGAEMHDLQNCLCEFDKFSRVTTGTGKAKRAYAGR